MLKQIKTILKTAVLIAKTSPWNLPAFIGSRFLEIVQPFVTLFFSAKILDLLTQGADRPQVVQWIIAGSAVTALIHLTGRFFANLNSVEGMDLFVKLYEEMSAAMMRADYSELENGKMREKYERIVRAANVYWYGPWEVPGVLMNVTEGLTVVISSFALAYPVFVPAEGKDWWQTVLLIALIVGSATYSFFAERKLYQLKEQGLEGQIHDNQVLNYLDQYITADKAAKDVRLYQQQNSIRRFRDTFNQKMRQGVGESRRRKEASNSAIREMFGRLISFAGYLIVGIRAAQGYFSIGDVLLYAGALSRVSEGARMLVYSMQHVAMQAPHCQEFLDFVQIGKKTQKKSEEVSNVKTKTKTKTRTTTSGSAEASVARSTPHEIRFEHVSFSYPGSTKPAVKDINIVIKNGEHLAIVGKNGSGKSTFVKLLCRMYEPQKGHIYLDGKEIRSYSKEEYWKILGVVFQDFALIGLPLAENIAASEEYDENKVRHCLKDTGLEEWVDQPKNGLNEWMSASEGTAPSGGEKQRLALARAQYRDPFLMVLDEPTAALDPVAESKVFQKCREIAGGTSAVYISHRLSACRFTDRILVFDEGSIVQEGSHDELAKQRGSMYAQLWQAQAQYYI